MKEIQDLKRNDCGKYLNFDQEEKLIGYKWIITINIKHVRAQVNLKSDLLQMGTPNHMALTIKKYSFPLPNSTQFEFHSVCIQSWIGLNIN